MGGGGRAGICSAYVMASVGSEELVPVVEYGATAIPKGSGYLNNGLLRYIFMVSNLLFR